MIGFSKRPLPPSPRVAAVATVTEDDSLEAAIAVVKKSNPANLTVAEVACWQYCLNAGELWKLPTDFTIAALKLIERGVLQQAKRSYSSRRVVPAALIMALAGAVTAAHAQQIISVQPNGYSYQTSPCQMGGRPVDCRHMTTSDPALEVARQDWIAQQNLRRFDANGNRVRAKN